MKGFLILLSLIVVIEGQFFFDALLAAMVPPAEQISCYVDVLLESGGEISAINSACPINVDQDPFNVSYVLAIAT